MITQEALQSALPLTTLLDDKKLYLSAIPGTPLERLVQATRSDANFAQRVGSEYTVDTGAIMHVANAQLPGLNTSEHDVELDVVVDSCVKAVQGHMQFARSHVAPAVTELVEKTAATLQQITPSSLLGMNVVTVAPPAPLQLSAVEQMARRYEDTPFGAPAMTMRLPTITLKEIVDLMSSGAGTVDAAVQEWVATKGETFFLTLWQNVFQVNPHEVGGSSRDFAALVSDKEEGVHHALAIFLISRRLVESPLKGTEMPLPAFENLAAEYRNQAAARLCRAFDEQALIKRTKQLVRNIQGSTTYVNETVYRDWIEAGGDNDVLFGNALQSNTVGTVDQINAQAEALRAKWARHAALTATVEATRMFNRTKEVLRRHFIESMRTIEAGEEATLGNRETVIKLFEEQLGLMREEDTKDLWSLCLRLVCRSRFWRTDAERILSGIERIKRENPSIDVREAAAVAVIEYIGFWVASQFKVQGL